MTHSLQPLPPQIIAEPHSLENEEVPVHSPIFTDRSHYTSGRKKNCLKPGEDENRYLSLKLFPISHHRSADDIRSTKFSNMSESPNTIRRSRHSTYTFPEADLVDDIVQGLMTHDIGSCRVCTSVEDISQTCQDRYQPQQQYWHPSLDSQQSRRRSGSLADVERVRLPLSNSNWRLGDIQEAQEESSSPQMPRRDLSEACASTKSGTYLSPPSLNSSAFSSTDSLYYPGNTPFIPEGVIVLDDECIFRYPSQFHAQLGRNNTRTRRSSSTLSCASSNMTEATSPNPNSHSNSLPITPVLTINNNKFPVGSPENQKARTPSRQNSHSLKVPTTQYGNNDGMYGKSLPEDSPNKTPEFRHTKDNIVRRRVRKNISPKMIRKVRDESSNAHEIHADPPDPSPQTMPKVQTRRNSVMDLFSPPGSMSRRISLSTTDLGSSFNRDTVRRSSKRMKSIQQPKDHRQHISMKGEMPSEKDRNWVIKEVSKLWKSRMSFSGTQMMRTMDHTCNSYNNQEQQEISKKERPKRRISLPGHEPSQKGLPDVLANVMGSGGTIKSKDGNSTLSSAFLATSPGYDSLNHSFQYSADEDDRPTPQLEKQKWKDLELWSVEAGSWSQKYVDINHLSSSERKKQDIIYELYLTEKNHCQTIVFLQQAYQAELQKREILTESQMSQLIPDVLDALLDFHLNFLRRVRERISKSEIVDTISDIILDEFEDGEYKNSAINAYTSFCLAREDSHKCYSMHMQANPRFKALFDHYESNDKRRSFKSCLLLIAQRLTKYPLLIEQITKYDSVQHKPLSQKAHNAVKSFALRVDRELWKFELNRRWESIRNKMDKSSVGQLLGSRFSYDDLVHQNPSDPRKVLSIGAVHIQNVGQKLELYMILFDDIIVFLHNKGGVLQFFLQQNHASVVPLHTALVREIERTNNGLMLIVIAKKKPDMYQLYFNNKTEMQQWIQAIKSARLVAPKYVRTAKGDQPIESATRPPDEAADPEEMAYDANIQRWQKKLNSIFEERNRSEEQLRDYFNERMKFFDSVRSHLKEFPAKTPRSDSNLLPTSTKVRENRDIERMKALLQQRIKDMRDHRRSTLDELVETAQKARDSDMTAFFDDFQEFCHVSSPGHSSNDSSATCCSSSASEENDDSRTKEEGKRRNNKPRRARTYTAADSQKSSSSIRRHTTVPKVGSEDVPTSEENENNFENQVDADVRKLPLRVGSKARKAATDLIREIVSLRIENNRLRNEVALQDLHIASLRARKAPVVETTEKLESLRQKTKEIQAQELDFKHDYESKMDILRSKEVELEKREAALKERESQIETANRMENNTVKGSSLPSSIRPSRMNNTMPTFRSGSAIHELGGSTSNRTTAPTRPMSTIEKSSSSPDNIQVPRHLVVKTETKHADKRKKK
ncbi:rhoGEF domain-containing protein [Ditylenchus destructor]|uniref:RhoGEF domain-containing protein n=1 Tax=Ditylenchus destructor TaxID=166010 RepID=A0AAD4RBT1_9BILA|nr:rhoGEF domain-containing protein [Ditylenchus destructor]